MACSGFVDLKELAFDRTHARHQAIEFAQKNFLVLLGFLDQGCGRTVTDPVKGIGQLHVQEPHGAFQVQEFLM